MMPEYNRMEFIIICVYLSFLSVLGTAGNALVLVVFYRKKDKQVSTFFIIVLAIVDFTTCLILIPCTIFMEYWDFRISQDFVCKSYMMLNGGMIHFSALIMVAIALERYFSICHPFLRVLTLKRAKYILVGLGSVASALGICIALTHGVVKNVWLNILSSTVYTTNVPISNISEKSLLTEYTNNLYDTVSTEYPWLISTLVSMQNGTITSKDLYGEESCQPNYLILSHKFQIHFQRLSNTLYLVYLAIVIILYALIYRSVMTRRARRQKQKSACLIQVRQAQEKAKMAERIAATVQANAINLQGMLTKDRGKMKDGSTEDANNTCLENTEMVQTRMEVELTTLADNRLDLQQQPQPQQLQKQHQSRRQRQKNKKQMVDGTMLANMKTAAMLFVVTLVFFITFTPAFLATVDLIEFKAYLFYLYFANNVANPIIYSFMNRNFRTDLKKLFCNKVD